ncbi:MAG: DsrE family protein [Acidobacteria bacterium]|nr:DsrE family protein [Acidobacteriota bacterium]
MKSKKRTYLSLFVVLVFVCAFVQTAITQEEKAASGKLAVLWTSGDPDVAHNVAFMYAHTAKKVGWFGEVTLIVWGPSQRLLAGDKSLQDKLKAMQQDGIVVEACVACAMNYGIVEELKALGVSVRGMGLPLTDYLKNGWEILTF